MREEDRGSGTGARLDRIERAGLDALFAALQQDGYTPVGPTVRDGAIVYDRLETAADLPAGWTDEQDGGRYRLKRRDDGALFGYAVGPQSWRRFLQPPRERLWRARRDGRGFEIVPEDETPVRYAFIGVRACELRAIAIQDRVLIEGAEPDPGYRSRRAAAFIVALQCGQAGGTCFCVSMQAGPRAESGFDLALTEVLAGGAHYFLIAAGSARGAALLERLPRRPATPEERAAGDAVVERTAAQMGRTLDAGGIKELLYANYEHPRWDEVATRCLSCANCTLVCPTCFCTTVEDATDLSGEHAERWQRWDSCFTLDFSYIHGGSVRPSPKARYRQWLTHKLATWIDQFGSSGCVGCGRCITWCPVGIDLTAEVRAIRAAPP